MKEHRKIITGILAALAMLIIILDTKTAIQGSREGINLCLQTVIPALFPYFILSGIVNNYFWGKPMPLLHPLAALCKIPKGSESLLLLGLIGGYPVGAQLIYQCYIRKQLTATTAKRMLGFCNNAGPAFIFGMLTPLFKNAIVPWILWAIHIMSALFVGAVLPCNNQGEDCTLQETSPLSLSTIMQNTIKITATISGWIIFFRIILAFCNRWFLWLFQSEFQVLFSGLIELSNGCCMLNSIQAENVRFIVASVLLAAGGICVGMQTSTAVKELGTGKYFPGKGIQIVISFLLSWLAQFLVFSDTKTVIQPFQQIYLLFVAIIIFAFLLLKKRYSIQKKNSV